MDPVSGPHRTIFRRSVLAVAGSTAAAFLVLGGSGAGYGLADGPRCEPPPSLTTGDLRVPSGMDPTCVDVVVTVTATGADQLRRI